MIGKDKVLEAMVYAICPKMKEWSNVKGDRDYACKNCKKSNSVNGDVYYSMCYHIAENVAQTALTAMVTALPELKPSFHIVDIPPGLPVQTHQFYPAKAWTDCDNAHAYYNEVLKWGENDR